MTATDSLPLDVRQRVPWLSVAGVLLLVLMTIGGALANMIPHHVPTAREVQRAEQTETVEQRRARLAVLLAEDDRCRPAHARELARTLIYDGQSALAYADDFARRCGDDPIVRRWGDASGLLVRIHRSR